MMKPLAALALLACAGAPAAAAPAAAAPAAAAPAAAPAAQAKYNEARELMRRMGGGGLEGGKLVKAIARAASRPLGSRANPVRENMPAGEQAYLRRLRCPGGEAPAVERLGNVGLGVFGNIVDHYRAACPGAAPVDIYMDMYHDGPETRPVPGFTLAPDTPPRG